MMTTFLKVSNSFEIEIVANLAQTIWTHHYIPIIGSKQVEYMLDKFQSTKAIKNQIDEDYEYYIICFKKKAVGYLCIRKNDTVLFLSKIYILSSFRGEKIGKAAFNFIDERGLELQCKTVMLTVNKYNSNSIAAYKRLGFNIIEELIIDIGNGYVMDDYKFEKSL